MNSFQRFAICYVLNHFNPGKSTPFFFKTNYSILSFSPSLLFSYTEVFWRTFCIVHLSYACHMSRPSHIQPSNALLIFGGDAKLISCLLCSFFNLSIFTSPRPLRFWVLQVKLTMKAVFNCCRECPNELIIITMLLNKIYSVGRQRVLLFLWGKFRFHFSRLDGRTVRACWMLAVLL